MRCRGTGSAEPLPDRRRLITQPWGAMPVRRRSYSRAAASDTDTGAGAGAVSGKVKSRTCIWLELRSRISGAIRPPWRSPGCGLWGICLWQMYRVDRQEDAGTVTCSAWKVYTAVRERGQVSRLG